MHIVLLTYKLLIGLQSVMYFA